MKFYWILNFLVIFIPITPNVWASYDHIKLTKPYLIMVQGWACVCIGGQIDTVVVMGGKEILKNVYNSIKIHYTTVKIF
jgi:hypothetical protein